jgi:hypothetical protein
MHLLNTHLSLRSQALQAASPAQHQLSLAHAEVVSRIHLALKPYSEAMLSALYLGDYDKAVPLTDDHKAGLFDPLGLSLTLGHKHSPETLRLWVPEPISGRPMEQVQLVMLRAHPYTDQVIGQFHPHTDPLVMVYAFIGVVVQHFHPDHLGEVNPALPTKQADMDVTTRRILLQLLDRLGTIGFGSCAPIDGADAVDAINQILEHLKPELAAIDIQPHVIHSASEKGYWNDEYGWTGIDIASHYYVPPEGRPDSAGVDATLLPLAEALAAGGRGAGA